MILQMLQWLIFPLLAQLVAAAPITSAQQSVVVTQYQSGAYRMGGNQIMWNRDQNGWASENRIGYIETHGDTCDTLLENQALAPLSKMLERGFLSPERFEAAKNLNANLVPELVTFFELEANGVKTATLWSVSGQSINTRNEIQNHLVPWMIQPEWLDAAKQLDRKKYKLLWEWGRGSSDQLSAINDLYAFATTKCLRELRTIGGQVEDAWITVHPLSPAHAAIYSRGLDGIVHINRTGSPAKDSVLLIPLKSILTKYPLATTSQLISDLKTLSKTAWPDSVFADLIESFRLTIWSELDYRGPRSASTQPLVIDDFSDWALNSILTQLLHAGLPFDQAHAMVGRLLESSYTKKTLNRSRYVDVVEPVGISSYSRADKLIEISGLDSNQLAEDPYYLQRVLFAGASRTIVQAKAIAGPNTSIRKIWEELILRGQRVALTTRDPKMMEKIEALRPVRKRTWVTEAAQDDRIAKLLGDDWGTTAALYEFNFGQFLEWTLEDSNLDQVFETANSTLSIGRFHQDHEINGMDLY